MANLKTLAERMEKLQDEMQETAESFGEILIDDLDLTTPTEFKRYMQIHGEKINKSLIEWRQKEEDKTANQQKHQQQN